MIQPPYLKKGDKIAITCPAKTLSSSMQDAIMLLESWGLTVVLGETVGAVHYQFSGTDELRASDMQALIDDKSIKAIIAARGGYGCLRIVDQIDWNGLLKSPKWIIGFSDITVFHMQLQKIGLESLHAQMPSTITKSSSEGLESLRKALFGENFDYTFGSHPENKKGISEGILIGGNLTLLTACLASESDLTYDNKILFIEDVGEYPYAIDRMLRTLDRAGKFKNLKGLIVGGFTSIKAEDPPFGYTVSEIISLIAKKYDFPICFSFPAGHLPDNRALRLGRAVRMEVNAKLSRVSYI